MKNKIEVLQREVNKIKHKYKKIMNELMIADGNEIVDIKRYLKKHVIKCLDISPNTITDYTDPYNLDSCLFPTKRCLNDDYLLKKVKYRAVFYTKFARLIVKKRVRLSKYITDESPSTNDIFIEEQVVEQDEKETKIGELDKIDLSIISCCSEVDSISS